MHVLKKSEIQRLCLTDEMLNLLGVSFGDEVEVSVADQTLIVRSPHEPERRQRMIEKTTDTVLKRRETQRILSHTYWILNLPSF
ncbi:MAG: hypothetical protein GY749_34245 [Desulfobacteraceae bacterium]|nr:hypothetical protein [Desulfobacteraceae bacterium]